MSSRGPALSVDLSALDSLRVESYVLFLAQDERPPQGLAGLIDWRLAGALSQQLKQLFFTAKAGDSLLLATSQFARYHPLPGSRLFVFGLGPQSESGKQLESVVSSAAERLKRAGAENILIGLPSTIPSETSLPVLSRSFSAAGFTRFELGTAAPRKLFQNKAYPSQISQPPPARAKGRGTPESGASAQKKPSASSGSKAASKHLEQTKQHEKALASSSSSQQSLPGAPARIAHQRSSEPPSPPKSPTPLTRGAHDDKDS